MKPNKIDSEKFSALEELSQIQMKLSDARVAFENFKNTEEEYLKQRETDVSDKLNLFIGTLEEAFKNFSENKETFERIKNIISEFSAKAVNLTAEVKSISAMLVEKIANADTIIQGKMNKIREESNRISQGRAELKTQLEDYNHRLRALGEAEAKLNHEKIAFEEQWQKINN